MANFRLDAHTGGELNRLLDEALDLPPAERERWLAGLDAKFDVLKPSLRDILSRAAAVETDDFMAVLPVFTIMDGTPVDATSLHADEHVGPYRLQRELGSGGMGAVWLAVRSDGLLSRPVALKLPHGTWRRDALVERMAREREILSSLNHPNIARLYDAGVDGDGRPYLAIEFVEGEPIDAYCRKHALDATARLHLVIQVANAVAYAHGKLVIHRDLKPANILVTAAGEVRLLDFGIAKLLAADSAQPQLTEFAGRALTPDYASPEQIRGEALTVASDVYSLGVLLYELLTDTRPYKLKRESRGALEEAILELDPRRPSEVAPAASQRALRGDLDTIVLKTLKKDSKERYATVNALVDDLERHLTQRPVLARPDSRRYRFGRFVMRNKVPVAATAIVALGLLVGTSVVLWQSRAILIEQQRSEAAKDFIANVFREADPTGDVGRIVSATDLLRQAEQRLNERTDIDAPLRLELLVIIGESLFGLQEHEESARVFSRALELQASMQQRDPLLTARLQLGLSRSHEYLGLEAEAREEIDHALETLERSGNARTPLFARAKVQQSALAILAADYALAERAANEGATIAEATIGPMAPEISQALQQLSYAYTLTQRRKESVDPARRAFELMRKIHQGDLAHPKTMEAAVYYATAMHATGDFEGAHTLYRDTLARAIEVFGAQSRTVGEILTAYVPLHVDRGELDTGIAHARDSVDIYLSLAAPGSVVHVGRVRRFGAALLNARRSEEAAARLAEAAALADNAKAALEGAHSKLSLGLALAQLGRFDEGAAQVQNVIDNPISSATRAQHLALRNMGGVLRLQGRYREALGWLDRAIPAAAIEPGHRADLAQGLVEAGLARLELGEIDDAQRDLLRARTLFDEILQQRVTPTRADLYIGLARIRLQQTDATQALDGFEAADTFWQAHDPRSRWAAEASMWLGHCYLRLGREAEAAAAFARARPVLARRSFPVDTALLALDTR